jgi:prolyl-tRNA synthetase
MPLLHPKEVWNETGRWDSADEVMYKLVKDGRDYALSFTHEEIVMDLMRRRIESYKDLPVCLYHFSTKFRSELRAKSGILRGREFLMKDLYSAHATEEEMWKYYWQVAQAYMRIFERIGVKAIIAEAHGGVFTDNMTHEFQVESEAGEDTIYLADGWKYAKNEEVMTAEDRKAPGVRAIRSIEVGNIFAFGTKKYSEMMRAEYTDRKGEKKLVWFASYGIGVTRMIGVVAEVSHDENGLIWPRSIAPFDVHLIELPGAKDTLRIYNGLREKGVEVLWDDRDIGAGEKFADADLIGIPFRLVVSKNTGDKIEWKERASKEKKLLSLDRLFGILLS